MRLHPDEALFAAQARTVSAWGDILLRGSDLDKPPLAIYSLAASFALLGPSEFAARLPNVFASVLTLAVLYRLDARIEPIASPPCSPRSCWRCPPTTSRSPRPPSPTQATLWALAAALLAARGRWAGRAPSALVVATKLNAALALPLIVALGWRKRRASVSRARSCRNSHALPGRC